MQIQRDVCRFCGFGAFVPTMAHSRRSLGRRAFYEHREARDHSPLSADRVRHGVPKRDVSLRAANPLWQDLDVKGEQRSNQSMAGSGRKKEAIHETSDSLHDFWNTDWQRKRVIRERDTAWFIQSLWRAGKTLRNDPDFLKFLVRCGWTNQSHGRGLKSTIDWRNRHLAEYLSVPDSDDEGLESDLVARLPSLKKAATKLIRMQTGITHCYGAVRAVTLDFIEKERGAVASAFREVASGHRSPKTKLARVIVLVNREFENRAGKKINVLNGITPTLACLDPARRFPIMNAKTRPLLKELGRQPDYEGALELCRQIGTHNIKDSFELDVYAATQFPGRKRKGRRAPRNRRARF